jgi:hypothetical protein
MLVNGDGQETMFLKKRDMAGKGWIWDQKSDRETKSPAILSEKENVAVQSWPIIAMEIEASQDPSCGIIIQKCWLDEHLNYGNIGWNADTMHMPTWTRLWYRIKMWCDVVHCCKNMMLTETWMHCSRWCLLYVTKWHCFTLWRLKTPKSNTGRIIRVLRSFMLFLHYHAGTCSNRPCISTWFWNFGLIHHIIKFSNELDSHSCM